MTLRSALAILLLAPVAFACGGQTPDPGANSETRHVNIVIDDQERVFVDGERVAVGYLRRKISRELQNSKATFVITVARDVPMGLVSDVQQQIPAEHIARIEYPEPDG